MYHPKGTTFPYEVYPSVVNTYRWKKSDTSWREESPDVLQFGLPRYKCILYIYIIYTCESRQKLRSPAKGLLLVSYIKNLTKFKGEKRNKGLPKKFQDTYTYIIYIYITSTGAGHVDGIVYFAFLQDIFLHSWSFYQPTMLITRG